MQNKPTIKVKKEKSMGISNLLPRYDQESNILEVGNPNVREWPYGIDIDGNIVFDLDKQRKLVNFDLLIPMDLWKKKENIIHPKSDKKYDLVFDQSTIEVKSFNLPLSVFSTKRNRKILIRFNKESRNEELIKLSDSCMAILSGTTLSGFYIKLNN